MNAPTKAEILNWDTKGLATVAKNAETCGDAIQSDSRKMGSIIGRLDWVGESRESADHRVDSETAQRQQVAKAYFAIHDACDGAAKAITPMLASLKSGMRALEGDGFAVSNDWTVTDRRNYPAEPDDATRRLQQQRTSEAQNESARLQRLAADFGAADEEAAARVRAAADDLMALAPVVNGLSRSQADLDTAAYEAGTATPEQLARLAAATTLSDADRAALADGKNVTLRQGQFDYLTELMRSQDGRSPTHIASVAEGLPAGDREKFLRGFVNGMQIASNPSIQSGSAGVDPSAHGGMQQLPSSIRTLITENPVERDGSVPMTKQPRQLEALADLMAHGDKSLAAGTDLDRGMLKQASEISDGFSKPIASKMLSIASADHTAVHDFLTGANMDVTTPGGRYNATDHLDKLINQDWTSYEGGAVDVVKSVHQNATSSDSYLNREAGESAHALAAYVGSHKNELLHIGWADWPGSIPDETRQIGEVNPRLTQALGSTLKAYIPDMVGVPDDFIQTRGFDSLHSGEVKDIFAVINSNHEAAVDFNRAAYSSISQLDMTFGRTGMDDAKLGEFAGRIDWAAQHGLDDELASRVKDAAERQQLKADLYDSIKDGGKFAVGEIPIVGPGGAALIDLASPHAKTALLGSVPEFTAETDTGTSGSAAAQYRDILLGAAAADASLRSDPHLRNYFNPDGTVKTLEQIAGGDEVQNLPGFKEDMQKAFPESLTGYQLRFDDAITNRRSNW